MTSGYALPAPNRHKIFTQCCTARGYAPALEGDRMTETTAVKTPTMDDLETLRADWAELEGEALIRAAYEKYGNKLALLSSFGADAAVTLSLVAKVNPNIPVLFLDTHKHFAETLAYVDTMKQHLGLTNIQVIEPDSTLTEDRKSVV